MANLVYITKTFSCKVCGKQFTALHATGRYPTLCSDECRLVVLLEASKRRRRLVCEIDGCGKAARPGTAPICGMHYHRMYRTGRLDLRPSCRKQELRHSGGYVVIYAPDHPLTFTHQGKYEYQHRVVFYDVHGDGPFHCHLCSAIVGWDTLHVDHLNDIPDDNRIENLAPACPTCNTGRSHPKLRDILRDKLGIWIEFNGIRDTTSGWAARVGISRSALMFRLNNGWPIERALTERRGRFGPPKKSLRTRLIS